MRGRWTDSRRCGKREIDEQMTKNGNGVKVREEERA